MLSKYLYDKIEQDTNFFRSKIKGCFFNNLQDQLSTIMTSIDYVGIMYLPIHEGSLAKRKVDLTK